MPTYVAILDAEVAPESPTTTSLMTRLRDNALSYLGAPTGTRSLFQQTAAPLGWTKDTSHNDKALRIVSGAVSSAGSVAFSTLFGRTVVDDTALTTSQIPVHSHGVTDPGHTHPVANQSQTGRGAGGNTTPDTGGGNTSSNTTGISIQNAGGGAVHAHGMDMRVQYVDTIIAQKD